MRSLLLLALAALSTLVITCGGQDGAGFNRPECSDGLDNDGDGMIDFPDDLGCTGEDDTSEDSPPAPQCKDGRDNDGDGKIDYPADPGCFAPHQDDETDDCPDGPGCPQCSDGIDNDENGKIDWPADVGGCLSASDTDEYTRNPAACGSNVNIAMLPFDGVITGTLAGGAASSLTSPMCGGTGVETVYELRIKTPKVVVATTDFDETSADTVLYIRGANCMDMASEMSCHDDISTTNRKSTLTQSISTPGTYYLVVDSKDATGGSYKVSVKFLTGEGETCGGQDDCGPGLVCRVPFGGTEKVCSKHVCEDGLDDDGDGKIDYPNDPGCTSPQDDDESDGCPGVGPNCPECGDGVDNDMDGKIDYGPNGDPTCTSASSASEACVSTDGVTAITTATTASTTLGAVNDVKPACATTGTHTAPDRTFRLDLPAMQELSITNDATWFDVLALYDSTCTGTALQCTSSATLSATNLAAGAYYLVVDGYSTASGPFNLTVAGKIQNGASCESPLAQSGAITCGIGYTCKGTVGSRTCQPSQCLDGIDNDNDGKIDYPFDPGCTDPGDNSEVDPATAPVCSNGIDDDNDQMTDFPADYGCVAASGTTEVFCAPETDPTSLITTATTTGTTVGAANDQTATCASSTAPEKSFALQLPVPVQTLKLNSSGFDTVLSFKSLDCATTIACNDEDPHPGVGPSEIIVSNVAPGGYAVVVDGWLSNSGAFTLTVKGTVAPGTRCGFPLFNGGANAVLVCPMNTTCTGTPAKCQ
jgi:large repetitive protein